jgi:DTW domain-containing protein YfiP
MMLYLLTHSREIHKTSNTGRLVAKILPGHTQVLIWQRKVLEPALKEVIEAGNTALLYPGDDSQDCVQACTFDNYILLDGTWQEAQKMYNKSPYLKNLPKVKINSTQASRYTMRRNQKAQGLCTAECVIELLKSTKETALAEKLTDEFELFIGI